MSRSRNIDNRMVAVAVVAAVLVSLQMVGFIPMVLEAFGSVLRKAAAPAYSAGVSLDSVLGEDKLADCACAAEIAAELDRIRVENAKLRSVLLENEELKAALSFSEREDDTAVVARVISESSDETFHGLVIDRGSEQGLAQGQPVIAGGGIVIGKIDSVSKSRATVLLLTDSMSKLAVSVQNGTGTLGVLEGDRGLSMSIALIPSHEKLTSGDAVITSGIEPGIRRGLAVGVIDTVHLDTQDPFQTATVAPFEMSDHPVFVQVLIPDEDV